MLKNPFKNMNSQELKVHFEKGLKKFKAENEALLFSENYDIKNEPKEFIKSTIYDYCYNLILELPNLTEIAEEKFQKNISYLTSNDKIKAFCQKKMNRMEEFYHENEYAAHFSVDKFQNQIFKKKSFDFIIDNLFFKLISEFNKSDKNSELFLNIIEEEKKKLRMGFFVLINTQILKYNIEKINNEKLEYLNINFPNPSSSDDDKYTVKDEKNLKETILEEQNNLIPKVKILEVYNHFKELTEMTNRNDEFYLTNDQLLKFIKTTFIDLKPDKQSINCKGFKKRDFRKVFYDFYFKNKNKESNHRNLKRKYFNILDKAFYGFNENDYQDFAK